MNRLMSQLMNRSARLSVILGLLICSSGVMAASSDKKAIDQKVVSALKAVWLARLPKYTDWPKLASLSESTAAPITIGLFGRDPNRVIEVIRERLAAPGGLTAKDRRLQLMDLTTSADSPNLAQELQECEVLFLSEDAFVQWSALKPLVESQPILTVGESDGFAEAGGVVEIYPDPKKDAMVMRINLQALRRSGLTLSATILSLDNVIILDEEADAQ